MTCWFLPAADASYAEHLSAMGLERRFEKRGPSIKTMSNLLKSLSWMVAGVALYHFGTKVLAQTVTVPSSSGRRAAQIDARRRLLNQLTEACRRGVINN